MGKKVIIGVVSAFSICVVIVIIVLVSVSFGRVENSQVALLYSHASRRIDRSKLYTTGRYYVGVGGEFITFPLTQREMQLPEFESRTSDGMTIYLQVSLNYKVGNNLVKVLGIFDHFGFHFDGFISRLATNVIRDTSSNFSAFAYSVNRSLVGNTMERDLRAEMDEIGFVLESLQLLNIQFPTNFSNALSKTLMIQQQVVQAQRDMEAVKVSLKGEEDKSNITAEGIRAEALTEATTIERNAEADGESLCQTLEKEGAAHLEIINMFKEQVGGDEAKAKKLFVQWFWMNQVSSSAASKNIAVGIPSSLVDMPSS